MFYAKTKNGKRISSYLVNKNDEYFCPICGQQVILKKGKINVAHFSHKNLKECDDFSSDMSEWHIKWQEKFPEENREVIISHTFTAQDTFVKQYGLEVGHEYKHRADICIGKYVIEFQHSSITKEEFMKRNYFYAQAWYKVIWIFDFINEYLSGKMKCYGEWNRSNDNGGKYKWNNPPKFLSSISPQRNKIIKIFFQTIEENPTVDYLSKVTWAIENGIHSDYKRFFTSYKIGNFDELYDALVNNLL